MSIGSKIKDLCADNDISLRRLAKEAYISNVTIYNYANDRSCPSAEVLHDIAKYFGVTMESFWDA